MLNSNAKLSELQVLFDDTFGRGSWVDLEPETIMLEFSCPDMLLMEKIYVLKVLNKDVNSTLSLPEFLLWTTSVCNNDPAEFETMNIPSCLELAWMIEEVKRICLLTGQVFKPSEELGLIVAYLLRLEGFSSPITPFEFVPAKLLEQGQTEQDTLMKQAAIRGYIKHMKGELHA